MNTFEIIKTVRLTEKGTKQGEQLNQYTVVADPRANKVQIRQAVQDLSQLCEIAATDAARSFATGRSFSVGWRRLMVWLSWRG